MTTDLVVHDFDEPAATVTLFQSNDPVEIIAQATRTAGSLAQVIRSQKLAVSISGRDHVRVEGWTLLGTLLGVFPYTVWTKPVDGGWEARCEARTLDGRVVGAAEAECLRSEKTWANRDDYALRSMAQTRATSKAMRQPLGFVMTLAGFEATPAEEMPRDKPAKKKQTVPEVDGEEVKPGGFPGSFVVGFGKYKGQTIAEIADHDRQYVGWVAHESSSEEAKAAAAAFLRDEEIPF